jgi:hypothetical protein
MPWKETAPMTKRVQFIAAYLSHVYSMTEGTSASACAATRATCGCAALPRQDRRGSRRRAARRTGDGLYCYPLTVADAYSRFLCTCSARLSTTQVEARPIFERLFQEYGMPQHIRTDNSVPFATNL